MLSTEKWDNWENLPLLVRSTALTAGENANFTQLMARKVAFSVDKYAAGRSFIITRIRSVTIVTFMAA
ncbi:hypothetical protein [Siccibacter turicensis]|uniref:hypothetical protein n=1 Tax=Siccibacter turicensis TaxID=357233 RepID=UPI00046629A9|nr:hypothetical protein [Siccibacter turicensis]